MARGVFRRRIRQPRRRFVHTVAASNDRTVSTTAATWSWNANAATISRDRGVNTTAATWSWNANAATVSKGRNVETTAATWSWTANAATITRDLIVTTTAAAWTWNAEPATVSRGEAKAVTRGGWIPPRRKRKRQKPEWQRRDEERRATEEDLESALRRAFEEITGEVPETDEGRQITREAISTVAPFVDGGKRRKRPPSASRVDFERMAQDAERAMALLDLAERKREEEAAAIVLLLM